MEPTFWMCESGALGKETPPPVEAQQRVMPDSCSRWETEDDHERSKSPADRLRR